MKVSSDFTAFSISYQEFMDDLASDRMLKSDDWTSFVMNVLYHHYTVPYIWMETQDTIKHVRSAIDLMVSDIQRSQSRNCTSWHNVASGLQKKNHQDRKDQWSNVNSTPTITGDTEGLPITTAQRTDPLLLINRNTNQFSEATLSYLSQSKPLQEFVKQRALPMADILSATAVLTRETSCIHDLENAVTTCKQVLQMLLSISDFLVAKLPDYFLRCCSRNPVMAKAEASRIESLIHGTCLLFVSRAHYTITGFTLSLREHPDWQTMFKIASGYDDEEAFPYMHLSMRELSDVLFTNETSVHPYLMGNRYDQELRGLLSGFLYDGSMNKGDVSCAPDDKNDPNDHHDLIDKKPPKPPAKAKPRKKKTDIYSDLSVDRKEV